MRVLSRSSEANATADVTVPPIAICDTSVLLRLFHDHKDEAQRGVDALARAWRAGDAELLMLDLSIYEFINVTTRKLGWSAQRAARGVAHLFDLEAGFITCDQQLAVSTARTAVDTGLTGYDAAFVTASRMSDVPLVTTDGAILEQAPDLAIDPRRLTG